MVSVQRWGGRGPRGSSLSLPARTPPYVNDRLSASVCTPPQWLRTPTHRLATFEVYCPDSFCPILNKILMRWDVSGFVMFSIYIYGIYSYIDRKLTVSNEDVSKLRGSKTLDMQMLPLTDDKDNKAGAVSTQTIFLRFPFPESISALLLWLLFHCPQSVVSPVVFR